MQFFMRKRMASYSAAEGNKNVLKFKRLPKQNLGCPIP